MILAMTSKVSTCQFFSGGKLGMAANMAGMMSGKPSHHQGHGQNYGQNLGQGMPPSHHQR